MNNRAGRKDTTLNPGILVSIVLGANMTLLAYSGIMLVTVTDCEIFHLSFSIFRICKNVYVKQHGSFWNCIIWGFFSPSYTCTRLTSYAYSIVAELTMRQDSNSPDRILSPSKTMSPAITALVVAIAGMMFPAMAETN